MKTEDLEVGKKYYVANHSSIYEGEFCGGTLSAASGFAEFRIGAIENRLFLCHFWEMEDFDGIQDFIGDQISHWKWKCEQFKEKQQESETGNLTI